MRACECVEYGWLYVCFSLQFAPHFTLPYKIMYGVSRALCVWWKCTRTEFSMPSLDGSLSFLKQYAVARTSETQIGTHAKHSMTVCAFYISQRRRARFFLFGSFAFDSIAIDCTRNKTYEINQQKTKIHKKKETTNNNNNKKTKRKTNCAISSWIRSMHIFVFSNWIGFAFFLCVYSIVVAVFRFWLVLMSR